MMQSLRYWPGWFAVFKTAVYLALTANIGFFFQEEWQPATHLLRSDVSAALVLEAFAATIDTTAWVLLLLMFELETHQLDDSRLTPGVNRLLILVRALCYGFIVFAFIGYVMKGLSLLNVTPLSVGALCDLAASGYQQMPDLDEFLPLAVAGCASSALSVAGAVMVNHDDLWVVTLADWAEIKRLASVDVSNSATWILIVIMLEFEVRFGVRRELPTRVTALSKPTKIVLYSLLILFAAFWGFAGSFLDFWDAFLWIVAFVFIERNVFVWEQELERAAPSGVTQ
jgi:hypothetical protein